MSVVSRRSGRRSRVRLLIDRHRGDNNRLGFAVQLGTVRFRSTFLPNPAEVPPGVVAYVPGNWTSPRGE
jgi:hypothetical protein